MDAAALVDSVQHSQETAYLITADGRLVRCNQAWSAFAIANGGATMLARWGVGVVIFQAFSEPFRTFYVNAFARALATGQTWEHDYECSSPELFRRFRMRVLPVDGAFLFIVHSRIVEAPHTRIGYAPADSEYAIDGFIKMCAHCRRVRHPASPERWDWVPAYVANLPANTSHGICEACLSYYFGEV